MTAPVRAYRALLRLLLPAGFNDAFAAELTSVFAELDREVRNTRGTLVGGTLSWLGLVAELPGLVRLAITERRTSRTIRARNATARLEDNMFDSLVQDIGFALRALRRAPGFVLVATITLALGIGANTAIFSVVNGVLLSPLPLGEPDRLLAVGEQPRSATTLTLNSTSPASFFDWKSSAKTMQLGAYSTAGRVLTGRGEPEQLNVTSVAGGTMNVLGVAPFFGRQVTEADEAVDAPPVILLSFDLWHRLFGEDRGVLGQTLVIANVARTIVGVMPAGFTFPAPSDAWMPAQFDAAFRANRDQYYLSVVGRLAPGATIARAQAEMNGVMARLTRDYPRYNDGNVIALAPLRDTIVGSVRSRLLVLMGAVAFVLLITCANIGNLLLARASGRRREIAVRQALGASTTRIARQLLTESVLLGIAGGALGIVVGRAFLELLLAAQATTNLPRVEEITLDGRVLLFTFGVSIIAGLFFGSVPAWQLARSRSAEVLRDGARGSSGHQWARSTLVVSELALAMILLTGAGLLLRSFSLVQRVDPGLTTDHVLTFTLGRPRAGAAFFPASLERISAVPGVRSAAITNFLPLSGRGIGAWFNRIDRPLPENVRPTGTPYRVVSPDYFATVGIQLKRGRLFDTRDDRTAPAIVINEALARRYYPNEDPIGKPVYLGAPDNRLFESAPIVGVVGDTRDAGLGVDPLPIAYIPQAVIPMWPAFSYVVRTSGDPLSVVASVRRIVRDLDPNVPMRDVRTLDDLLGTTVAPARWSATLLAVFAGVALVMAVLGVFGVLSYIITQRTRELGIRIALGASAARVRRLVVMRGLRLVAAGLAIGIVGAAMLTRFMSSLLYGVTPTDRTTFVGVAVLLAVASVAASYVPARRATRVDPIVALRAE